VLAAAKNFDNLVWVAVLVLSVLSVCVMYALLTRRND
jgi:hypothetical protein